MMRNLRLFCGDEKDICVNLILKIDVGIYVVTTRKKSIHNTYYTTHEEQTVVRITDVLNTTHNNHFVLSDGTHLVKTEKRFPRF